MVKLETIKPVVRSRSSSSSSSDDSDDDDIHSTSSSSDSGLSLIETSTINSSKSYQKRQIPTSVHIIPQGTIIHDINNNSWILHQCIKVSKTHDKFLYLCSQMKKSLIISEDNIIKTKISPLIYFNDKFKQSRQTILDKAYLENDKLNYIFYGTIIGDKNQEIEFIYPTKEKIFYDFNTNKILHGIIEFLKDDETYDDNDINKYTIEILFHQEKIYSSFELFQDILKKEIENLKLLRQKKSKILENFHKYLIKKNSKTSQYDIQQILHDDFQYSSNNKYLLKLELTPSSKSYTIDNEISFYSRFATHDKLKTYIKRHNLIYIAIPEYISHGIYKHLNLTYKFLIMEQYRENLRSLIYSYDQSLPEHNALNLFLQMLYVIQFLHEKNFVHQLIKPKYLMFTNKQPYFIFLTQFRTIYHIENINQEIPKENFQLKKKLKHSHRTQLAAIHNKTSSIGINTPNSIIEDENSSIYYHPYSIYSSLDMHLNNKQTYRGDLEMLGYNLIVWSGGRLPWEKKKNSNMKFKFQQLTIINEKKLAKSNVNEFVKKCFFMKLISPVTLRAICDYMSTIYQLNIDDIPNFDQLRAPIKEIVKALGFKANACLRLSNSKSKAINVLNNHTQIVKTNGNIGKHIHVNDIPSSTKELEVEQDDLEDEDDNDDEEEEEEDEEEEEEEEETHPCPPESSLCEDNDENNSTDDDDDDTQMEEQNSLVSGQIINSKCKRCGGDHSIEDQQFQTNSDKQSSNNNNNNLNTLTYQQKRQRSIAKRLQLRRKKKN